MSNYRSVNFYDLCRICTSCTSEQKIHIFSTEGKQKNLPCKISECLPINVDEKDRLPKVLCSQCLQNVEAIMEFRSICKNSQAMLNNCLTGASNQNGAKIYIKDATINPGIQNSFTTPAVSSQPIGTAQSQGITFQSTPIVQSSLSNIQSNDLVNLIVQAVGAQSESIQFEKGTAPKYTITVDRSPKADAYKPTNATTKAPVASQNISSSDKESKYALEEFLKMKPNIKVTAISKKDVKKQVQGNCTNDQQQGNEDLQFTQLLTQNQHAQLQQQWTQPQQQSQLQLQTSQIPPTGQISISAPAVPVEMLSPSRNKKPKLNFVLTSPNHQSLATTMPQIAHQPQIQLQLQTTPNQQSSTNMLSNLAPLLQQVQVQTANCSSTASNLVSPNKCFLPITIKDENSEQQIVAHIDAKNFMLPTTYQLQMKLLPQITMVDGQPIVQLTPTSIPIQITPHAIGNQVTQQASTTGSMMQQQNFQQQNAHTPQQLCITSHQILKPANCNYIQAGNDHLMRNDAATSTTSDRNDEESSLGEEYDLNKPNMMATKKASKYKITQQPGSNTIEIKPTTNLTQQIMQQVQKQKMQKSQNVQKQEKAQQTATVATTTVPTQHGGITVQRITAKTVPNKSQSELSMKLPMLMNKQNVTISRITNQQPLTNKFESRTIAFDENLVQKLQVARPNHQPHTLKTQPSSTPAFNTTASKGEQVPLKSQVEQKLITQTVKSANLNKKELIKTARMDTSPKSSEIGSIISTSAVAMTTTPATATVTAAPTTNVAIVQREVKSIQFAPTSAAQVTNTNTSASTNTSNWECSQCGRAFKKKEHLTQHSKLHAGLRPFKCSESGCDKAFSRKEHLLRHQVSHSGKKMFSCEVCQKPFSRKDNLNKHRRIHSGQSNSNNYTCEVCNKMFAVKSYYEQHKQMHDKSEDNVKVSSLPKQNHQQHQQQESVPSTKLHHIEQAHGIEQSKHQQHHSQHQPQQHSGHQDQLCAQQVQIQQNSEQPIMHLQLPTVVTTQDLAGNTITITQTADLNNSNIKALSSHDNTTVLNLPSSLANYVQLGQAQFVNATTGQIMGHIKIEK